MKLSSLIAGLALCLLALSGALAQQNPPAAPTSAPATISPEQAHRDQQLDELKMVVNQVRYKVRSGQTSAQLLAPELAQLDALRAKYAAEKSGFPASVAMMKAALYLEVIGDPAKARELLLAVKTDFPASKQAHEVDHILETMDHNAKAKAAFAALIGKPAPEIHFLWSSKTGLKTLSDLRGKVVVLDFWATWCGPCLASFPKVREHVAHYQGAPVAFLGVTSIQGYIANMGDRIDTKGDPAREMALMPQFMKAKEMTWDVAFSKEDVFNPDYGIQGIPYVAIIAPDGTVRFAGLHPGNPQSDIGGKIDALLKEFKLNVPAVKS